MSDISMKSSNLWDHQRISPFDSSSIYKREENYDVIVSDVTSLAMAPRLLVFTLL